MQDIYYYYIYIIIVAVFGSYVSSLQGATLYWGRTLQNRIFRTDISFKGLQNALTPPAQNVRNILSPILLISTFLIGLYFFSVLKGIIGFFVTIVLSLLLYKLFPKRDSDYYFKKMIKILNKKKSIGEKKQDLRVVHAADDLIEDLKELKK